MDAADALLRMRVATQNSPPLPELDSIPQLHPKARERVIERIDAGYREGLFAMSCDDFAGLMCCIMPDDYEIPPPPAEPTDTPPGPGGTTRQSERVKVYVARCRKHVGLWHRRDAQGDAGKRGLKPVDPGGRVPSDSLDRSANIKVGGWQDESHLGNPTKAPTKNGRGRPARVREREREYDRNRRKKRKQEKGKES